MNCPNCEIETQVCVVNGREFYQCPTCPFNHSENDENIEVVYAWVAVSKDGKTESILGINDKGVAMAAVTSKLDVALQLKAYMHQICRETGLDVRMLQLSHRMVIEEIKAK